MKRPVPAIPSSGITRMFGKVHEKTYGGDEAIRNLFGNPAVPNLAMALVNRRKDRKKNPMSPSQPAVRGIEVGNY